nr:MAG: ORF1 [TTV-like mini virus]
MRYWRRNPYRWRRRRPRYYWKRRFRRPIWRRFWRHRYRVRKRKLKTIKLKEWQPPYIRKTMVKGFYPIFLTTNQRLTNNLNCYLESTAPYKYPGGGGFTICNFSLNTLYQEHLIAKNWWTAGNENMPLIRYNGCKITLYREEHVDYLFSYNRCWPMVASKTTYMSTCPQAMLLNKNTIIVTCKRNSRNKKPYKVVRIKPPVQLRNRWYFQKDLCFQPLLQIFATCCSLDRMFLNSSAISTTLGFTSLDTNGFKSHNFPQHRTSPYEPFNNTILFASYAQHTKITDIKIGELIILGDTYNNTEGTPFEQVDVTATGTQTEFQQKMQKAKTNSGYWGNPFYAKHFHEDVIMLNSKVPFETIVNSYTQQSDKLKTEHFQFFTQRTVDCRYNPFKDKGTRNIIYLVNTDSGPHLDDWSPPSDEDIVTKDIPLWLALWGYLDFQRKCNTTNTIDLKTILVIQSPYIIPNTIKYYVPLDQNFLDGHSPYDDDHLIPSDYYGWHPKVRFQVQSINKIGASAPAAAKLPDDISVEGHIKYQFYFKVGGQPAPMSNLTDPNEQPKWTTLDNPNNLLKNTSLQNPATPFEYILYNFDQRRDQITKRAAKRIKTDKTSEEPFFSITETSSLVPTTSNQEIQTSETSDEEEEEAPIETQLLLHRREQRLLRKRINKLLNRLAVLE